jgi:hypothetical protein
MVSLVGTNTELVLSISSRDASSITFILSPSLRAGVCASASGLNEIINPIRAKANKDERSRPDMNFALIKNKTIPKSNAVTIINFCWLL